MQIEHIELINFRNYKRLSLPVSDGATLLLGDNAQGKTNLLEAVFFCCMGRSHRTARDAELISHGENSAFISVRFRTEMGGNTIEIRLDREKRKAILLGGKPISSISGLLGRLRAVLFVPENLFVIKSGMAERRRMFNMDLCTADPVFFASLRDYRRALAQRNTLLRAVRFGEAPREDIYVWDELLARHGYAAANIKAEYMREIGELANRLHKELALPDDELKIEYSPGFPAGTDEEGLLHLLQSELDRDIARQATLHGPHHDRTEVYLNGYDARLFASQGQQRTIALALRLAAMEYIKQKTGETPVLLLDDVLSELDDKRRDKLFDYISRSQTIITCASESVAEGVKAGTRLRVRGGEIFPA